MKKASLYRTLFLLDETRNFTNDFYIYEFVKIVLFENGYFTLSLEEIQKRIEQKTSLLYTQDDILHAISIWNDGDILCRNNEYSLTSKALSNISKKEKSNNIKIYIDLFLKNHPEKYDMSKEDVEALIERFIFQRFNENLQQIADILNQRMVIEDIDDSYTETEKTLINEFLNWDNFEKHKCVYNLIAKSYDYCMINSKCANSVFDFNKITFYLDTNIIFRLLGMNGNLREASVKTLIDKCRDVGINLVVSNFVKEECEYTINSQISLLIESTTKMNALMSPSTMSFAEEKSIRIDFYKKYYEWVKKGNIHRNYDSFKKYIINELAALLETFEKDNNNPSYKIKLRQDFEGYYASLFPIKSDKHTTETDINSFLHILDKRNNDLDREYFLISADKKLMTWLKEIFPSAKSIADYPSAWLSIILKYTGREIETDYKAFCQFIHLSIEPKIEDLEKKILIKADIMGSDLDEEIKTLMIEEVKNNYSLYKEFETEEVVHKAYGKIKSSIEAEVEIRKDAEHNSSINALNSMHDSEIKKQREYYEQLVSEERQKNDEAYEKGKREQEQIEHQKRRQEKIDKIISKNTKCRMVFKVIAWSFLIICIISWLLLFFKGKFNSNFGFIIFLQNNSLFVSGLLTLLDLILFLAPITINGKGLFPIDQNIVEKKLDKKEAKKGKTKFDK